MKGEPSFPEPLTQACPTWFHWAHEYAQSASIVDPLLGNDAAYVEASERLGSALAAAGVRLIYGGGTAGVMGAVAHGTLSAGGEVGAIIPSFLINRETTKAALTRFKDVTITEVRAQAKGV